MFVECKDIVQISIERTNKRQCKCYGRVLLQSIQIQNVSVLRITFPNNSRKKSRKKLCKCLKLYQKLEKKKQL